MPVSNTNLPVRLFTYVRVAWRDPNKVCTTHMFEWVNKGRPRLHHGTRAESRGVLATHQHAPCLSQLKQGEGCMLWFEMLVKSRLVTPLEIYLLNRHQMTSAAASGLHDMINAEELEDDPHYFKGRFGLQVNIHSGWVCKKCPEAGFAPPTAGIESRSQAFQKRDFAVKRLQLVSSSAGNRYLRETLCDGFRGSHILRKTQKPNHHAQGIVPRAWQSGCTARTMNDRVELNFVTWL